MIYVRFRSLLIRNNVMIYKFMDLLSLFEKYNMIVDGVIHVGAHIGQEIDFYEKISPNKIAMFEPVPSTFERLKNKVGNRAVLYNKALGNERKMVEINIETANDGQSNSILEPGVCMSSLYPHIIFDHKILVELTKLDDYVELFGYNFINIDTQGYELEVLKGGSKILRTINYIVVEVNKDEIYKNCPMIEELDNFLKPYGFKRVETSWENLWGNSLYVKWPKLFL